MRLGARLLVADTPGRHVKTAAIKGRRVWLSAIDDNESEISGVTKYSRTGEPHR